MSRSSSPYIVGDYWLDRRRDGVAPRIWQIASARGRTIVYRSTRKRELVEAKAVLDAYVAEQRAQMLQDSSVASVAAILTTFWKERGRKLINSDQTSRSLRTFAAFMMQDTVGVAAVVTDLTPALFERFREWRMGPHELNLEWFDDPFNYASKGVSGATVQRNLNDIRAAVNYAAANMRIPRAPLIRDIDRRYQSPPRDRLLSIEEMGRMAWYASQNADLFRFLALQLATAVRPAAALKFDPCEQYDDLRGLIDLHPGAAPQTKKRNAVVPAIRPIRPVLRAWALEGAKPVASRKTAWRIMRRTLGLSADVYPKTIRHTVATLLYADPSVPEREVVELLGHAGKLPRTTQRYAKFTPSLLRHVSRALGRLWLQVSRAARAYGADHLLTTGQRGDRLAVIERCSKC